MVHYLIQGRVNHMARTTPSDGIPLGDSRGTPRDYKTTKTYVIEFIQTKRRIKRSTGVEPLKKVARSAAERLIAGEGLGVREKRLQ